MTGRPAQPRSLGAELLAAAPFFPQLGDLAHDTARDGRIGVVVALPGQGAATYHLRPPGGGAEWSAPADGTTLRPVPAQATHVTPMKRDAVYDHHAQQGTVPVQIHYEDGGTSEALLVLTPDQMELYHYQVGRIIGLRGKAREDAS
ncbi:hypothetical protein [Streptomyces olivoreticuli]|uniref:hypothetical protein n=1 Tax=Streptomyces olivoreticuli TaxID=68246 RepID=UPI001F07F068|nr:hypothetical protein [Streptomyces olivoreticuli]